MANRYWVGGTGNWDASTTTNWSASSGGLGGASVPTSSDAVIFDANSNATAYTVTVTATASCSDISFTNPASGALTFAGSSVLNVYGNFTILSTITYTHSGTLYIYNQSAGTTKTISTNNVNIKSQIYFGGVATGTRQLLSNIGYSSTVNMNLDGGILDLNGYTLDVSIGNQGTLFQIQSSYTRTIIFGSGTLKCGGFDANGTNLTITAGTGTILLTGSTATFLGNGKTYNIVSFIGHTSYSSSLSITGNNTFGTLTLAPTYAAKDTSVTLSGNQIVSGTFTLSGNSAINRILIKSNTLGTARTITAATVAVTNADFMDITGDGAATWDMSGISGGSGNCGGNSMKALGNAAFTAATNQTWSGTSGGFWSMNGWTTHIPLPQDTALFNVAFGTSKTVTVDMPRVGSIDMTGATWTTALTLSWGTTIASYGSLTLISGLTMGGANLIELGGRGSYVIDTKTVTISRPITLLAPMGTYTLLSAADKTTVMANDNQCALILR